MKTYSPKPEHIERRWYVLDAGEQVLGRVASEAAVILRGKHKPIFAPHMDVGDNLIIINAAKVVLTGGKETKKVAWRHSGHPGGITGTLYEDLLAKRPAFAVEKAVRGMLPKNRLGRAMIKKLHVVAGPDHRHQAQKPEDWTMGMRGAWEGLPTARVPAANGKAKTRDQAVGAPVAADQAEKPTATVVEKPAAKKPAAKKPTARKTTAAKTAAAKKRTARKTTAAKKPTVRKTTAARKTTARKTTAGKPAAKAPAKKKET
jgi:large subunit ribosomal protein L13